MFAHVEYHVVQGTSNPTSQQRWQDYGLYGTPTVFFDGQGPVTGAGNAEALYRAAINAALAVPVPLTIEAQATLDTKASTGSFSITLTGVEGQSILAPEECNIRAVIYEDDVFFCCGAGGRDRWDDVSRLVLEGGTLALDAGTLRQTVNIDFSLDPAWNPSQLHALVFVQRGVVGEILNGFLAEVSTVSSVESKSWGRIKALYFE